MNRLLDIASFTEDELVAYILELGEKKFRGQQIFSWLHQKKINAFEEMTNIPQSFIGELIKRCEIIPMQLIKEQSSKDEGTKKFLFELYDGQRIESVFMPYKHGNSVCISSQAGCKMGCKFCASTLGGLIRNLTPSEMLRQIYQIENITGEKVSNIVIMGTGEPFDNYENLLRFLMLIRSENGLNIGSRSITISTCGIVPKILDFAELKMQVNLAISLHAPTDELRKQLMPIAYQYDLKSLMDSCRTYIHKTHRRISFEYSLIRGINDREEDAIELAKILKGLLCHVNLIPINPVEGKKYEKSEQDAIYRFQKLLIARGLNVTIRRSLGTDVDAACGQLRMNNPS